MTKPILHIEAPSPDARRRWWIELGAIALFWTFVVVLMASQRAIDPRGPEGFPLRELLQITLECALWLLLTPGIFWLSRRFGFEGGRRPGRILLHVGVALLVAIGVDFFSRATFYALLPEMTRWPFDPAGALLRLRFLDELFLYLVVLAAGFARDYFLRYRERQEEATQLRTHAAALQAQLADARLEALRMQLNPHFLFNTLHAVSSLVERDPRGVRRMIARLSALLRYTLEEASAQEVPLRQELRFLHGYLEIQQIRFQGKLEVEEEIAREALDAFVPNLILQPLVENAIKHGASQISGVAQIGIQARREGERLVLRVRDNGPGLGDASDDASGNVSDDASGDGASRPNRGVGLRNTRERLEGLYGTAQRFTLAPAEGGGLVAEVIVPYRTEPLSPSITPHLANQPTHV